MGESTDLYKSLLANGCTTELAWFLTCMRMDLDRLLLTLDHLGLIKVEAEPTGTHPDAESP